MRAKTKATILTVLSEAFKSADMKVNEEFANTALAILRKRPEPTDNFTAILVGGVWAGVARALDDAEEPSSDRLKEILTEMKAIPYTIRRPVVKGFDGIVKELPHAPGGRPRKLSDAQVIEVRLAIGELDAQGVEREDAFKRVAQRYEASVHTIQRAWRGRKEGQKGKP